MRNTEVTIAVDISSSMEERDCPGGVSRWEYVNEVIKSVTAKADQIDEDGFDLYLFNHSFTHLPNARSESVKELLEKTDCFGSTTLSKVLKAAFDQHFANRVKKRLIIVLTDGATESTDRPVVPRVIAEATNKLENRSELGVSFIQVGQDPRATAYLKALDDDLTSLPANERAKFDIVDVKSPEEVAKIGLTEALLAAFND